MAKAGYCSECGANVWLREDGSCQNGHPATAVSGVYEPITQPESAGTNRRSWPLVLAIIVAALVVVVGLCAVVGFSLFALSKSEVTNEWRARIAEDYPGWRVVGFDARSFSGAEGTEKTYTVLLTPPDSEMTVGVIYRSVDGRPTASLDHVFRSQGMFANRAESLLDYLGREYVRKGKTVEAVTSDSSGAVTVYWARTRGFGPFSMRTGSFNELAYDEATGRWSPWRVTKLSAVPSVELPDSSERFTESNYAQLIEDPDAHRGAEVEVVGRVFGLPDRIEEGTHFQMRVDPSDDGSVTMVVYPAKSGVSDTDYVKVHGRVYGAFHGRNESGERISSVLILADTLRAADMLDIGGPPEESISVGKTVDHNGLKITVDRVEFRADEARVFVTVRNDGRAKTSFFGIDAYTLQGGSDTWAPAEYTEDYPEVEEEIGVGEESSGVLVFRGLDPAKPFNLSLNAYLGNAEKFYRYSIEP